MHCTHCVHCTALYVRCVCTPVYVGMQELNKSYDAAKAQLATNDTFTQV